MFSQTPTWDVLQRLLFSTYKHHHTLKTLVVMNTTGHFLWMSPFPSGKISDVELCDIYQDQIFKELLPGDCVQGDKLSQFLPDCTDEVIPPTAHKHGQTKY
eukprot:Awhi_evm2s6404